MGNPVTRAAGGVEKDERMSGYAELAGLRQLPDAARVLDVLGKRLLAARKIVDLGCGTGELITRMAHAAPGAQVIGLDASAPRIARLRAAFATEQRFEFEVHDLLEPLPGVTRHADIITMTAVLHWLHPNEDNVLAGVSQTLNASGAAVLTTYHPVPGESGLGGTDSVVAEATGIAPPRASDAFSRAGIVGISDRTCSVDRVGGMLSRHFSAVTSTEHDAVTAPTDGEEFARYVDATFGDYYQPLFPGRAAQYAAIAAAAQRRLDSTGFVTAMPVRTWVCTTPRNGAAG